MAVNKSRQNKVYNYSYTFTYDMESRLYADTSYFTDQYTFNAKIVYNFKAYTTDYQALVDLCIFIKSLPNVISCTIIQTYYGPYQLDFTLDEIDANKAKNFMDAANKKAEMEDKTMFLDWFEGRKDDPDDYISNCGNVTITSNSLTIFNERRNGKGIEKDMQKFIPKRVIYSGGKTIVIWPDNSKTIVSCRNGDQYDEYAGFCAALAKKIFGTTSVAKRIMNKNKKVDISKDLEEVDYEAIKKSLQKYSF